jgi:hypothetical protein
VFIRFVSAEFDETSLVLEGLFGAAYRLWSGDELPDYESDALLEVKWWFDDHLDSPFDYLPPLKTYDRAICWFKPTAREHLARAWELSSILERNDVPIWVVKTLRTGYVHYEDEAQVFAKPFHDMRFRVNGSRL